MGHMQQKVVQTISKPPSSRRDVDVQFVLPWLRKKSNLFTDLDKSVLMDVIRNCAYMKACKDEIIIEQGEKGDSFFIMLTGKTSVFIDTLKSDEEAPADDTNMTVESSTPPADLEDQEEEEEEEEIGGSTSRKLAKDRSKYGKFIINYEEGKSFGEIALMSDDSVRNATVIADEDTDLLIISRELFNRSMKAKQEAEYQERQAFIKKSPFFSNWSVRFKRLLEMSLRKEYFHYGATIVKQGDPSPGLLFIISGSAKIVMNPSQHAIQYPTMLRQSSSPIQNKIQRTQSARTPETERDVLQCHVRVRRRDGYAAAEQRHRNMAIELCCIEQHDVIGDVEMALELDTCVSTVVCNSNATVMVLDNKNYDRLVAKKNQHTITKICQKALQKVQCRCHTTKGSKIPLLHHLVEKLKDKLPRRQSNFQLRQQITDLDKQKEHLMEQLVELFLKGQTPMIQPFVPNALYYRKKSMKRAEMIEHQKRKMNGGLAVRRSLYDIPKRKVARSMKQLKTANAEQELLSPNINMIRPMSDYTVARNRNEQQRPRTAIGISRLSSMRERTRPMTASDAERSRVFLTECSDVDGSRDSQIIENDNEMFLQIDYMQKEKYENRSRIVCSATAREELMNDMRYVNHGKTSDIPQPYDDVYFDWETSEGNLCRLEDKIRNFCNKLEKTANNKDSPIVSSLKRFSIQDDRDETNFDLKVPKPGGTVLVKTKVCDFHDVPTTDEAHNHVRRFILTRENIADHPALLERPKSSLDSLTYKKEEHHHVRPRTSVGRKRSEA